MKTVALTCRIQRQEALGEDLAVGGLEVGLDVAHSLGGVVLLRRHVAPEIRRRLGGGGPFFGGRHVRVLVNGDRSRECKANLERNVVGEGVGGLN